jgi:CheY-like chemotaxis protein
VNPKAANTAHTAPRPVSQKDKDSAKQCLMLADKLLKDGDFVHARAEVTKAQKLDPSNPYAYAFLDRIAYFEEQQRKKEAPKKEAEEAIKKAEEDAKRKSEEEAKRKIEEEAKRKREEVQKKIEEVRQKAEAAKQQQAHPKTDEQSKKAEDSGKPAPTAKQPPPMSAPAPPPQAPAKPEPPKEQPKAPPAPPKHQSMIDAARPVIAEMLAARSKPEPQKQTATPAIADVLQQLSQSAHHSPTAPKGDIDGKLDEMRRQIEMLTKALDQERKVREEMNQQQLKGAVKQLRSALEKAWVNGVPNDTESAVLHELATSVGIPEDVEQTLNREVKLEMYSRAVKEVVAKQKLLRNSSRTLEWLRKVYNVTMDEYLEYESKFLLDLVADQYKGTILLVSCDEAIAKDLGQRLKSVGYAVVNATSPENALEKIEKINPHYVLCDMEFTGGSLSGIKFLHVLRANSKFSYTPFILMCQAGEITQLKSSELRPTEGFVEKPIEMGSLNAVMNEKLMAFRQYLSSL